MSLTLAFKGPPARPRIDRQTCSNCGSCARVCSSGPLGRPDAAEALRRSTAQIDKYQFRQQLQCVVQSVRVCECEHLSR